MVVSRDWFLRCLCIVVSVFLLGVVDEVFGFVFWVNFDFWDILYLCYFVEVYLVVSGVFVYWVIMYSGGICVVISDLDYNIMEIVY